MAKTDISYDVLANDSKRLDAGIVNAGVTGRKLNASHHLMATAIVQRSLPQDQGGHMDCSRALKLMKAMPPGGRAKALRTWFTHFSNIRFEGEGDKMVVRLLSPKAEAYNPSVDVAAAFAKPYYELTVERTPEVQPYTDAVLQRTIKATLDKAAAANDKGKLNMSVKGKRALATLQQLLEAAA